MPICPFCGLATPTAHHTQGACIQALNEEIARMRMVLERTQSAQVPGAPEQDPAESGLDPVLDDGEVRRAGGPAVRS